MFYLYLLIWYLILVSLNEIQRSVHGAIDTLNPFQQEFLVLVSDRYVVSQKL